jgi:hypothetical protein
MAAWPQVAAERIGAAADLPEHLHGEHTQGASHRQRECLQDGVDLALIPFDEGKRLQRFVRVRPSKLLGEARAEEHVATIGAVDLHDLRVEQPQISERGTGGATVRPSATGAANCASAEMPAGAPAGFAHQRGVCRPVTRSADHNAPVLWTSRGVSDAELVDEEPEQLR